MAKQEFLTNLRVAKNLFNHANAPVANGDLDPQARQGKMARAAIWLTPHSVRGFDVGDFMELGPDKQRELADAVRGFLDVANQVPPTQVATSEQISKGKEAFEKLMRHLDAYLATWPEAEKMEEVLQTVHFPDWVVNWDFNLDEDWVGDPAVYIWAFGDKPDLPRLQQGRQIVALDRQIRDVLNARGIKRLPYVKFRGATEHKAM